MLKIGARSHRLLRVARRQNPELQGVDLQLLNRFCGTVYENSTGTITGKLLLVIPIYKLTCSFRISDLKPSQRVQRSGFGVRSRPVLGLGFRVLKNIGPFRFLSTLFALQEATCPALLKERGIGLLHMHGRKIAWLYSCSL